MNEELNPTAEASTDLIQRTMTAVQNASTGSPQAVVKMFDYAGASTCLPVSTIYVMDVTDANANAIWYPGNEENAWEYAFSTSDSMTAAELEAAALPVTTNNVALSGLVRDTNYTFDIRPVCSATEKGSWNHTTFTTPHVDYYYDVTVNVNDDEMGEVEGLTHVLEGTDTILVAEANRGYHFVSWSNGRTTASITVTADADATYTATFAADGQGGSGDNSGMDG